MITRLLGAQPAVSWVFVLVLALPPIGCSGPSANANPATAAGPADPLQGAWNRVETRNDAQELTSNQPGYRFFVDGHYALVRVEGMSPRPAVPDSIRGTAKEFWAVWGPSFAAQAGTYELVGDTVVQHAEVAKNPAAALVGNFTKSRFRIAGDTLWFTNFANQNGPLANLQTGKYVRDHHPTGIATQEASR